MNRTLRQVFLGAMLGSAACTQPGVNEPAPNPIVSTPRFVDVEPTARIAGWAWDPEAYWYAFATANSCALASTCPLQPPLSVTLPQFQLAAVRGAKVEMWDSSDGNKPIRPAVDVGTPSLGQWLVTDVPGRVDRPFFAYSSAVGATLATAPVGGMAPPPAATGYLPTVVNRPIVTHYSICLLQESVFMSDVGVLNAVARFLSTRSGTTVRAADLIDRTRYDSVNVFWLYQPGQTMMRMPAHNTFVEASVGEVLHIGWAPPGAGPVPAQQSPRGYYVSGTGAGSTSNVGVEVVLVAAGQAKGPLTITPKDGYTGAADAATQRPWVTGPVTIPPRGGLISVNNVQFRGNGVAASPPPSHVCAPL